MQGHRVDADPRRHATAIGPPRGGARNRCSSSATRSLGTNPAPPGAGRTLLLGARKPSAMLVFMAPTPHKRYRGPFRADQIASGDSYELSCGNPIYCEPTGGSGSGPNALGASVVEWDPAVEEAGVDAGYSPEPGTLRAPDVAVGNVPNRPGWIPGAPALAIEYADIGQDEPKLQEKIADLLAAGTKYLWVVRLSGPRRVEVFEPGKPTEVRYPGEHLTAPGVLKNPVLIEALYDRS